MQDRSHDSNSHVFLVGWTDCDLAMVQIFRIRYKHMAYHLQLYPVHYDFNSFVIEEELTDEHTPVLS